MKSATKRIIISTEILTTLSGATVAKRIRASLRNALAADPNAYQIRLGKVSADPIEAGLSKVAAQGEVLVTNGSAKGIHRDDWTIEAYDNRRDPGKRKRSEPVLGWIVHDSELDEAVGAVTARFLRSRRERGEYITSLTDGAVLGLRGSIPQAINSKEA